MTHLQNELALARLPGSPHVANDVVYKQKSAAAAFSLACNTSGLDDKEIYLPLEIDAGHFARMKKGDAGFPPDKLRDFCLLVGNRIYLEWQAHQVGCGLVQLKSEAELRADAAEARLAVVEQRNAWLEDLIARRAQ